MATLTVCETKNLRLEDFEGLVRNALYKHTVEISLKILEENIVEHLKKEGIKAEAQEIRQAMIKIIGKGTFGVLKVTTNSCAGGYHDNERVDIFSAAIVLKSS